MKLYSRLLGTLSACLFALPAFAAKLGDAAEPLTIKDWIKGGPVNVKDGKNLYVVEFWATWCGPCKVSIPHLTDLQKKFKDKGVVVVGVSDESAEKVRPFVEKMGDKMDYVVACDDARQTFEAYMQAFGQNGIPHAFIVSKDAKIIWHGHPMAGLDEAIEQILAGKYDMSALVEKDAARNALQEYQQMAAKGDAKAKELGRKLMDNAGNNVQALVDFAFFIVANPRTPNRDFELAAEALDKAQKLVAGKDHRIMGVRAIVLFETGKQDQGLELARQAAGLATDERDQAKYRNFVRVMEKRMQEQNEKAGDKEKKDSK